MSQTLSSTPSRPTPSKPTPLALQQHLPHNQVVLSPFQHFINFSLRLRDYNKELVVRLKNLNVHKNQDFLFFILEHRCAQTGTCSFREMSRC